MKNFVLNFGRQLGSGGREIGAIVAEKLNIAYYDKELIQIASKESGLAKEFFEQADERATFNFWKDFAGNLNPWSYFYGSNHLFNESLFKIQSDVIRELAGRQSCVFVGRCADYVLRDHPHCINFFVSANTTARVERLMQKHNIESREKAVELIQKADKKRSQYYNYYTNKEWGIARSYHLCIDSSVLGTEKTADFIARFVKERFDLS